MLPLSKLFVRIGIIILREEGVLQECDKSVPMVLQEKGNRGKVLGERKERHNQRKERNEEIEPKRQRVLMSAGICREEVSAMT
jgi:hypothetical protein